jgi:hypothetical protein
MQKTAMKRYFATENKMTRIRKIGIKFQNTRNTPKLTELEIANRNGPANIKNNITVIMNLPNTFSG